MNTQNAPAGYIATDMVESAIYGVGSTAEEAVQSYRDWTDFDAPEPVVHPASAALLAQVDAEGGDLSWDYDADGVAILD